MCFKWIAAGSLLVAAIPALSQDAAGYLDWQRRYKEEFLSDARSPLRAADTGLLQFFPYNARFVIHTRVQKQRRPQVVVMATHSGKTKRFRDYGTVTLTAANAGPAASSGRHRLHVYQALDSTGTVVRPNEFFLPFTDATNGVTTYGGGRYIDLHLRAGDLRGGWVTIDFNQAYNPWCAYKEGYNCPIPPETNRLPVAVEAGERTFGKQDYNH